MSASTGPAARRERSRFPPPEWFTLRRHPHPEFRDSLDRLPPSLAGLAETALLPTDQVQGALLLPAEYYSRKMLLWEYVPERCLIFVPEAVLHLSAEGPGVPSRVDRLDTTALLYIRSSILLLYGLLEFEADCGGQASRVRLEYNTVIWQALNSPLARYVSAACPRPPVRGDPADLRAANEAILTTLPFKFANGLRYYSLSPGERLMAAVFQPAIWQKGRLPIRQQVTPNTLLAITDRKLVIIEEQRARSWSRPAPGYGEYGWIFTYVPLDRVVDMSASPREGLVALAVELGWGAAHEERTLRLEPAVAGKWQEAWLENQERGGSDESRKVRSDRERSTPK